MNQSVLVTICSTAGRRSVNSSGTFTRRQRCTSTQAMYARMSPRMNIHERKPLRREEAAEPCMKRSMRFIDTPANWMRGCRVISEV